MQGTVKVYRSGGGFGFLGYTSEGIQREVFFHISNFISPDDAIPTAGQMVNFELGPAKAAGKTHQAINVRPIAATPVVAEALGGESVGVQE